MRKIIDLRSDTVTKPTKEMREASATALVGDDVFGDDPTVIELETYAAELLGMEAALFVSSGTQGNLISVLAQTNTGDEVIVENNSHIYYYEVGGLSSVGGTIPHPVISNKGLISKETLTEAIRPENVHYPNPALLSLENTHNRHGGIALSPEEVGSMSSVAQKNNLKVHLDGARIFNAVTYHNTSIKDYTKHVDSIQICLSKGLSAPVGSLVLGSHEFIHLARRKRKMLGGGMRQVGIIAAPGLIALRDMRDRLVIDHINARQLSEGLVELGLDVWPTQTNIVVCDISSIFRDSNKAVEKLERKDVLTVPFGKNLVRLTIHRHITEEDVKSTLDIISKEWFA